MQKALLALSLTLASLAATAQALIPFAGGSVSWNRVPGYNYSSKPVAGVNAGLLIDLRASSSFSLQTGLQYTLTGGKYVYPNTTLSLNEDMYRKHAIQVPVMLVLKTGDEDAAHFFAGGGFYLGANIAGTHEASGSRYDPIDSTINPYHSRETIAFTENGHYPKFEFGLCSGVGYRFANGLEICWQSSVGSKQSAVCSLQ